MSKRLPLIPLAAVVEIHGNRDKFTHSAFVRDVSLAVKYLNYEYLPHSRQVNL